MACDGLWDCFSSEEAIEWCHENIYQDAFEKGKLANSALQLGVEDIVDKSCVEDINAS